MAMSELAVLFGWISVMNLAILFPSTISLILARGFMNRLHSRLFGLDDKELGCVLLHVHVCRSPSRSPNAAADTANGKTPHRAAFSPIFPPTCCNGRARASNNPRPLLKPEVENIWPVFGRCWGSDYGHIGSVRVVVFIYQITGQEWRNTLCFSAQLAHFSDVGSHPCQIVLRPQPDGA